MNTEYYNVVVLKYIIKVLGVKHMFNLKFTVTMNNTVVSKIVNVADCAAYRGWSYVKLIFSEKPTFLEVYKALASLKIQNAEAFEKAMQQSHLRVYSRMDFCTDRSKLVNMDVKFDYANWLALENIAKKIKG